MYHIFLSISSLLSMKDEVMFFHSFNQYLFIYLFFKFKFSDFGINYTHTSKC